MIAGTVDIEKLESGLFLGVAPREWFFLCFVPLAIACGLAPHFYEGRFWPGAGLFVCSFVFLHFCLVASRVVAFPGLIAFAACMQWILAPWLTEFYPSSFATYNLAVPMDQYLQYAVPATVLYWLGLHLPIGRGVIQPHRLASVTPLSPSLRRIFDGIIVAGLLIDEIRGYLPTKYAFLASILGSLRFFVVFAWMITRTPGWGVRTAVILIHLLLKATEQTLFYQLIHWGGYCLVLFSYDRRWRLRFGVAVIAAVFTLGLMQMVKLDYRSYMQANEKASILDRLENFGAITGEKLLSSRKGQAEEVDFAFILVRFNQGWIISRIMDRVPAVIPYGEGRTLRAAVLYSVIPRVFDPNKPEGASRALFAEYTGVELSSGTAMGLSAIGEMYANFGPRGGLAASFAYAWLIGFIYAQFLKNTRRTVLWLALAPLILLPTVDPGWNIEDVWNHILKEGAAILFLVLAIPGFRRLMGLQKKESPRAEFRPDGSNGGMMTTR